MSTKDGIAVITGASEGIGRATAGLFAAEGHDLLLVARSGDRLTSLAAELRSRHGIGCEVLVADIRDAAAFRSALTDALRDRRIAAVVVNAGVGLYGPFAATPWRDIQNLLRTNFDGAFATASAVLPLLLAQRGGSLVFVSSIIGKRAMPYNAAYCATKQGLLGLADALRLEARPYGVHVGVVCPARTDTPFFERMTYSVPQTTRRNVPTNPPEMVAAAVLRCVRRRRREIVVSAAGKLFAFVGWHFPRLSDYLLYRNVPRPDEP